MLVTLWALMQPRPLTRKEKIGVLEAARLTLQQRDAEGDMWGLRDAIADGLSRRGWRFGQVDRKREKSITSIFAEVIDLGYGNEEDARIDPVSAVESWASTKATSALCDAIGQVVRHLENERKDE
jgi:hypothetical protein